jgi:hypothetical protein
LEARLKLPPADASQYRSLRYFLAAASWVLFDKRIVERLSEHKKQTGARQTILPKIARFTGAGKQMWIQTGCVWFLLAVSPQAQSRLKTASQVISTAMRKGEASRHGGVIGMTNDEIRMTKE